MQQLIFNKTEQKFTEDLLPLLVNIQKKSEAILFESADITTKAGENSFIAFNFALKFEFINNLLKINLLKKEGEEFFASLKKIFSNIAVESSDQLIIIKFADIKKLWDLSKKLNSPSPLTVMREFLHLCPSFLPKEYFLLAGAFSYDFIDFFEELPASKKTQGVPDAVFYWPLEIIHTDYKTKKTFHISLSTKKFDINYNFAFLHSSQSLKANIEKNMSDEEFYEVVSVCQKHIVAGDVYQIVPSRTFSQSLSDDYCLFSAYSRLRKLNPSPYMFFLKLENFSLFGASPETFLKVDGEKKIATLKPIAGTRKRAFNKDGSYDLEQDAKNQVSLCLSEKEVSEHMMLLDLARNDIASICQKNKRIIQKIMSVEKFYNVMHLVSEVSGKMREGFDAFSAFQSSLNMGTLVGAPKVKAASLLRKYEKDKRGFYGGAIGYFNARKDFDSAIIIRSAFVQDKKAYVRAGAGVVLDSDPMMECEETKNKAYSVLRAIVTGDLTL